MSQLRVSNYITKKFEESDPASRFQNHERLYNTMHGGFGNTEGLQNGIIRSATVTQGPFHSRLQQKTDLNLG